MNKLQGTLTVVHYSEVVLYWGVLVKKSYIVLYVILIPVYSNQGFRLIITYIIRTKQHSLPSTLSYSTVCIYIVCHIDTGIFHSRFQAYNYNICNQDKTTQSS